MHNGTYIHIMIYRMLNYTIEMYIWNQTGNYKSIISANTQHTSMATPTFGMYIS